MINNHVLKQAIFTIYDIDCSGGDHSSIQECCNQFHPCGDGEGDCDDDSECSGNLICGRGNCNRKKFPSEKTDCCENPNGNKIFYKLDSI